MEVICEEGEEVIFKIRPIRIEDAKYVHEMRTMDGVKENILGIASERITRAEEFINTLSEDQHLFVAEIENEGIKRVVGTVGLTVNKSSRVRHSASLGIMVHKDYQGMGIGRELLKKVLDVSDNWLMLVRIELGVFVDNEKAINLYKSLGFEIEGTKKYAAIRNGKYEDEYIMARYNLS
jgi:L-phenylalanine/L-methionine N-acetyltransferase